MRTVASARKFLSFSKQVKLAEGFKISQSKKFVTNSQGWMAFARKLEYGVSGPVRSTELLGQREILRMHRQDRQSLAGVGQLQLLEGQNRYIYPQVPSSFAGT